MGEVVHEGVRRIRPRRHHGRLARAPTRGPMRGVSCRPCGARSGAIWPMRWGGVDGLRLDRRVHMDRTGSRSSRRSGSGPCRRPWARSGTPTPDPPGTATMVRGAQTRPSTDVEFRAPHVLPISWGTRRTARTAAPCASARAQLEQLEQRLEPPSQAVLAAGERGITADLAQPRECREHFDSRWIPWGSRQPVDERAVSQLSHVGRRWPRVIGQSRRSSDTIGQIGRHFLLRAAPSPAAAWRRAGAACGGASRRSWRAEGGAHGPG
jgi:hypothetical protein